MANRDVSLNLAVGATGVESLQRVGTELAAVRDKTEALRTTEAASATEAANAKRTLEDQREALARLRIGYQTAGGDAEKYRTDVLTLRTAILDSRAALRNKEDALKGTSIAAKAAAAAERDLTADIARASEATRQQTAQTGALNTQLATQTKGQLANLGADLQRIQSLAAVAVGGSVIGSLVGDVTRTADAYKELAARIKLSTGEGKAFDTAFQGVFEVARRTNSAVAETGQLFVKINEAGKLLNLTQADALKLTETVNQSIQLSGGSAESAKAGVVQLTQALQSGVLRGDELNSVFENSPRLAKAFADGLGVTTGELRKLGEAGRLTSETVIGALQKQTDTVAAEFAKLPPTVGKALQNLSTEWLHYVGSASAGGGATTTAAKAIDLLAGNLSTVAGLLLDVGQAAIAFKAVNLAASFLGIGQAAQVSAAQVATSTGALKANAVASAEVNAASAGAGASVGRFAAALSAIKLFSAIGILANFKEIGTAIGEGIAKLAGYKDGTDALARADKLAGEIAQQNIEFRRAQLNAIEAAINKQFELSKAAGDSIATFDQLRLKGDSAAEALGKIGKDFDLTKVPGIRDASAVLDKLSADGKISAGELQAAYANALKTEDLGLFETRARAAFAGATREAERLAQALDNSTREAIRRTGLDFDVISGGMGKAARSAINDTDAIVKGLDGLRTKGVDTAQALTASIGKGISTADSQQAIQAVISQIESLRKSLGDKVADGLLDQAKQKANELKDALDKAKPGINSIREAFAELGLKSSEDLQRIADKAKEAYTQITRDGTVSASTKAEAFRVYADKAIAANNGVASESLKVEAAMRGLQIQTDSTGKTIVGAMGSGANSVDNLGQRVQATTEDLKAQADALDALNAKYGQSKADREFKYGRVGGDPTKTSDGFEKNKDGSAKGTFTNNLDTSAAYNLVAKAKAGQLAASDLESAKAAFKQAQDALQYMQAMAQLNPGGQTLDYVQSTQALFVAARTAYEKVQALANAQKAPPPSGSSTNGNSPAPGNAGPTNAPNTGRNITINLPNFSTNINVSSEQDANNLENLLQQLAQAKGVSR